MAALLHLTDSVTIHGQLFALGEEAEVLRHIPFNMVNVKPQLRPLRQASQKGTTTRSNSEPFAGTVLYRLPDLTSSVCSVTTDDDRNGRCVPHLNPDLK